MAQAVIFLDGRGLSALAASGGSCEQVSYLNQVCGEQKASAPTDEHGPGVFLVSAFNPALKLGEEAISGNPGEVSHRNISACREDLIKPANPRARFASSRVIGRGAVRLVAMGTGTDSTCGAGGSVGTSSGTATALEPEDAWIAQFDAEAFKQDIRELGDTLAANQGEADLKHLRKIIMWSDMCATIGICTLWLTPNPITVMCLSLWTFSRWTMIGHHVCHGGYDKIDQSGYFNRFKFAVGSTLTRMQDWLDWMLPEAWNVEHNNLHHYKLGEDTDPDLVERNLDEMRNAPVPIVLKYMVVGFFMITWKWFYYAPNTYKQLKLAQLRNKGIVLDNKAMVDEEITLKNFIAAIFGVSYFQEYFDAGYLSVYEFFFHVIGPYFLVHFLLLPLPFMVFSKTMFWNAVYNLVLADVVTNIHSFIVIVTNHAGDDLYRFDTPCKPKSATFYLRQVISSVNFDTGSDPIDFMHGWLNYQIEHHIWPQLSMLSYQKSQPLVKAICAKHGVPYVSSVVRFMHNLIMQSLLGPAQCFLARQEDCGHHGRQRVNAEVPDYPDDRRFRHSHELRLKPAGWLFGLTLRHFCLLWQCPCVFAQALACVARTPGKGKWESWEGRSSPAPRWALGPGPWARE
jgi:fatty acid desaturase